MRKRAQAIASLCRRDRAALHLRMTAPAHGRKRRHRGLRRSVLVLAAVLLLLAVGLAGYNWNLFRQIHTVDVKGLSDAGTGAESGTENILMVGSTDRCSLPKSDPLYQDCLTGHTGINSDVIMILHLVAATRQVSVLSIPRDTFVPNARAGGANKIDAGLVEGPSQLVAAIEDDFGIPIQHYVELNFASFANVVAAIGGIHMYFPEPVYDGQVGLYIRASGCVYLNGGDALKLVRSRELQYRGPGVTQTDPYYWPHELQSDLARITRDHEILRVLATAVARKGLGNPVTDERLVASLAPQVEMDSTLKSHLLGLAGTFHSVNVDGVPELTLPIQIPDSTLSYIYKGGDYGEVVYPTITEDRAAIVRFLGLAGSVDTMNGKTLPAPASVTVSVLNGTGLTNQATDTGQALAALGFRVGTLGDATPVGTPSETVVRYSSTADEAAAERVAGALSGMVIMQRAPTTGTGQVTVVTGTDFTVDSGPAAGSSSTSSSPPSGSTGSGSTGSSLAPPSPAVSSLAPWDPRSCTASGGEGR